MILRALLLERIHSTVELNQGSVKVVTSKQSVPQIHPGAKQWAKSVTDALKVITSLSQTRTELRSCEAIDPKI